MGSFDSGLRPPLGMTRNYKHTLFYLFLFDLQIIFALFRAFGFSEKFRIIIYKQYNFIRTGGIFMFGRVDTSAIVGIDGRQVIVEADFGQGLPSFDMVGFLSSEVREARERVKSAIKNSGITVPAGRLTVNLSPADLRKTGNSFDLPVALAILIALGILPEELCRPYLFVGDPLAPGAGCRDIRFPTD